MNDLTKRFSLFFIGVIIGVIVLKYWVNVKESEKPDGYSIFPYGPNARTLRSFERIKDRTYTLSAESFMTEHKIDTADISLIFKYGEVNFSKSHPRAEPCPDYFVSINLREVDYELTLKRCDSSLEVQTFKLTDNSNN
jgi:hypothetical protein